jgi:ceramide glucosyltransferase
MALHALYWILLVLAIAPLVYYFLSLYCVIAYFRELQNRPPLEGSLTPPASILKPVRGVDHEAYENFASFCRLDYPEYEIVFAVASPDDPAVLVIERLRKDFPHCAIRLVRDVARLGTNGKVNSLCRLVQEAKYEFLVMSDSDVRVDADYLRVAAEPFADSRVGAATAFYRCITGGGIAADLDALGMCADSAPGALVARWLEGKMKFAYGWTMATTKKHLAEIGGWEAMASRYPEDFELGNRMAQSGYRVALMRKPVDMVLPQESLQELLKHELRWSISLRNMRPAGYRSMALTHGLPWAVLVGIIVARAGWLPAISITYFGTYLALRLGVAWCTGVWGLRDGQVLGKLWLVPLRDAISFGVWVGGFLCNTITWRGLSYRMKNGQLFPIPNATLRTESTAHSVNGSMASSENIS